MSILVSAGGWCRAPDRRGSSGILLSAALFCSSQCPPGKHSPKAASCSPSLSPILHMQQPPPKPKLQLVLGERVPACAGGKRCGVCWRPPQPWGHPTHPQKKRQGDEDAQLPARGGLIPSTSVDVRALAPETPGPAIGGLGGAGRSLSPAGPRVTHAWDSPRGTRLASPRPESVSPGFSL